MSFISPIFALLGMLAIVIPLLIHLLNRRRFRTVEWAAMTWLQAAVRQNRRKMRFESWLLLATRALAVALVGLALARPLGSAGNNPLSQLATEQPGLHVFILDDSYSMQFAATQGNNTNFQNAKAATQKLISRLLTQSHQVAIVGGSFPVRLIVRPTFNHDAALAELENLQPTFAHTDLAGALRLAKSTLDADATKSSVKIVHVLSDASTASLDERVSPGLTTAAKDVRASARIVYHDVSVPEQTNLAVLEVGSTTGVIRPALGSDLRAQVAGFGRDLSAQLRWTLDDQPVGPSRPVNLSPDHSVQITSDARFTTGGLRVVTVELTGSTSLLPADDVRRHVIEVASGFRVLIVEGRRGLGPLAGSGAFLRLALAPPSSAGGSASESVLPDVISDIELPTKALADYRTIILAGVGSLAPETVSGLRTFVEAGGGLIVYMGENVAQTFYSQQLAAAGLIAGQLVARVDAPADSRGFLFDFNPSSPHPLLSAFRDTQRSGLDTAPTFTYFRIAPTASLNAEAILRFAASPANGNHPDPAVLIHTLGNGRVVTVATSADAEWSALVAKTGAYVALTHELLAATTAGNSNWLNLTVGQPLVMPPTVSLGGAPQLVSPTGRSITMSLDNSVSPNVWRSQIPTEPGVYTLTAGQSRWPVAVNVSAAEADVRPLAEAEIRKRLGEVQIEYQRVSSRATHDQSPEQDDDRWFDFGWPLMFVLFLVLAGEAGLAHHFGRSRSGLADARRVA